MSDHSLMTIQDMINSAFGEARQNIVNFKLLHTIFYILANQLRLLQRKVEVNIDPSIAPISSTLSVTEVKLKANVPKKRQKSSKRKETGVGKSGGGGGISGKGAGGGGAILGGKSDVGGFGGAFAGQTKKNKKIDSEKSETDKSSEITSSEKTTSKSTTDKTTTSSLFKTSTTFSLSTKTTTDQSSTQKSSTEKYSSDKRSTTETSSIKDSSESYTEAHKKKFPSKDYHQLLELIEQQREQELRVVNQRGDSREEAKKIPTPMTSLNEMEVQYEKLLIVDRVPTDTDIDAKTGGKREQPLSIVTQDQFDNLTKQVKELQDKFGPVGKPEFPENIELMQELRRGSSLTDAMAALQLSARVEAAEKTLEQMMSLVTDLAVKKGIDISTLSEKDVGSIETEVLFGAPGSSDIPTKASRKATSPKRLRGIRKTTVISSYDKEEAAPHTSSAEVLQNIDANYENSQQVLDSNELDIATSTIRPDYITSQELDEAMELLYETLLKTVTNAIGKSSSNADSAINIANRLERKIDESLNLGDRMGDLETLITEYTAKINTLDTGLSAYMTDYQEQLTQMQHDLEAGLESMAEALANTGGDNAAAVELNNNITNLQMDLDTSNLHQKTLKDQQTLLFADLEGLWKQIEILRGAKSDRDEVADALRDKAGLGALNGLVSQEQFDAVRGDFEKRIGAAYDKFNNQEIIWQKAIDDLLRELNEKADWVQVTSLRDDVNANLEKLRKNIDSIMDVVGEPHSAAVSKKLFQNTACLSCASPALMDIKERSLIPAFPAFPKPGTKQAVNKDDNKPKEDGDHTICYPGQPIPHPRDPRSHICQRYCGGSHTIIKGAISRTPAGMIVTPMQRRITTALGTDGRLYMTDEEDQQSKPCLSCNLPKPVPPEPTEADEAPTIGTETTSLNFLAQTISMAIPLDSMSITPLPPLDDD